MGGNKISVFLIIIIGVLLSIQFGVIGGEDDSIVSNVNTIDVDATNQQPANYNSQEKTSEQTNSMTAPQEDNDVQDMSYIEWRSGLETELSELGDTGNQYTSIQYENEIQKIYSKYYGKNFIWEAEVRDVWSAQGFSNPTYHIYYGLYNERTNRYEADWELSFKIKDQETALALSKGTIIDMEVYTVGGSPPHAYTFRIEDFWIKN